MNPECPGCGRTLAGSIGPLLTDGEGRSWHAACHRSPVGEMDLPCPGCGRATRLSYRVLVDGRRRRWHDACAERVLGEQ